LEADTQGDEETILGQLINYAVFDEVNGDQGGRKPLFSTAD
jgi:hypothetical protein